MNSIEALAKAIVDSSRKPAQIFLEVLGVIAIFTPTTVTGMFLFANKYLESDPGANDWIMPMVAGGIIGAIVTLPIIFIVSGLETYTSNIKNKYKELKNS